MRNILIGVTMLAIVAPVVATNGIVSFTGGSQFTGFSAEETVG